MNGKIRKIGPEEIKEHEIFQWLHGEMFAKLPVPIHNSGSYLFSYSRAYGILRTVV